MIIGTGRSAIGTIVERKSRSTLRVHLPRLEGYGEIPPVKNGPALGAYAAIAMNDAHIASMAKLPEQLRKTLTWDRHPIDVGGHISTSLPDVEVELSAQPSSSSATGARRSTRNQTDRPGGPPPGELPAPASGGSLTPLPIVPAAN